MTSDRPYRIALTEEQALHHLVTEAGTHLDPELTAAFAQCALTDGAAGVRFCYCASH